MDGERQSCGQRSGGPSAGLRDGPVRRPAPDHRRPDDVTDETVETLGKVSAALDHVEDARGHLFAFHRLVGSAKSTMEEAYDHLGDTGHDRLADDLDRDVLDSFYARTRGLHQRALDELVETQQHVFEAEMKGSAPQPWTRGAGGAHRRGPR